MRMSELINREPDRRSGAPCLDDTRLTVADVVFAIHYRHVDPKNAQSEHPALTELNIVACLEYCSSQKCRLGGDDQAFCEGCTLDKDLQDPDEEPDDVWLIAKDLLDRIKSSG
jgi:uncharacterized protein (DUF433 family)